MKAQKLFKVISLVAKYKCESKLRVSRQLYASFYQSGDQQTPATMSGQKADVELLGQQRRGVNESRRQDAVNQGQQLNPDQLKLGPQLLRTGQRTRAEQQFLAVATIQNLARNPELRKALQYLSPDEIRAIGVKLLIPKEFKQYLKFSPELRQAFLNLSFPDFEKIAPETTCARHKRQKP